LEVLKAAIRARLEKLIRLNKTRADFAEKFEELIESPHLFPGTFRRPWRTADSTHLR
jgi:hypothetical protein